MPRSLIYNPTDNRDSSSKVPNSAPPRKVHPHTATVSVPSLAPEHHSLYDQQQQEQAQKPTRDLDLTPDPVQAATPIASTGAINTSQTPSRSISRSPPAKSASSASTRYTECLKNHAASMGGHVLDGCGEFMPGGEEANSTLYKISNGQRDILPQPQHLVTSSCAPRQPNYLHQYHRYHHGTLSAYTTPIAPMIMSFRGGDGGGAAAESSSEDLNVYQSDLQGQASVQPSMSRKRFRTKFSQDQKDKMTEFAEKLGWRIQKQDDQELQQFCSQVGVKRKVFKVWMHNNKQAMKKKQM
ncbi:ZINC-FINGER HOMEODOMAIN PROTEIN 7 [Salix koriyanagi]|uniref:ZINC-FINGER HOMEODOMAIN PROTEIN 7 n=1 Tax=Salix koriyanagi TaxID=2511006 RepID=A0A9Q0UMJ9_9ROSI|nr:ZINC-FINGER HOMEODOMAIN PROTEIN 7 [Salix koriyanagi]